MTSLRSIAIVVPLYNEEAGLADLFAALEQLRGSLGDCELRAYFVDDHSSDRTPILLREACLKTPWFSYLRLSKRSGSHVAIIAGLSHCHEDCAAFIAADLQDPPALVPQMRDLCGSGHDIVWATWRTSGRQSWAEEFASRAFHEIMRRISQHEQIPYRASFAMLSRRAYRNLVAGCGANPSLIVEIPKLGYNVATLEFDKPPRRHGKSKWSVRRKVFAFADAVVASSYFPLRAMSYVGVATSIIGFLYAIILLTLRIFRVVEVEGWASMMIITLVLGGMQMLMLGIIGEYLWRTKESAQRHPLFLIEDSVDQSQFTEANQ
jgi:dolichol-phosphate mannosyltransferase